MRRGIVDKCRCETVEVAEFVVFLCWGSARAITIKFLRVDGGSVMTMGD